MDQEIKKSIRKLFVKFMLFQAIVFVAAMAASILLTAHFKKRIAMQLAGAARDSLLSGDSRAAISSLTAPMARDFYGMAWRPSTDGFAGFSIPAEVHGYNTLVYAKASVRVYFDEDARHESGEMLFYYHRWTPVFWAVFGWLVVLGLSVPVAFYERRRLVADYSMLLQLRIKETYATLAAQVAHDIRSPLAALSEVAGANTLSGEQRQLARGALERINGIAEDLLDRYRSQAEPPVPIAQPHCIGGLVGPIVSEKKLQFKKNAGVKIDFSDISGSAAANVIPGEFQRVVSNLINNAVEALSEGGEVRIKLYLAGERVCLEFCDNGKGIPPEILAELGQKGKTHGKKGGTGLGVYHAKKIIESWGGGLRMGSEVGRGTIVTVFLPSVPALRGSRKAVLLDDDPLVHLNWKMAAKKAGVDFISFSTPGDFLSAVDVMPRTIALYIDSDLGDGITGEEIALEMRKKGFLDITMSTGYSSEKFSHLNWLKTRGKEPPW